MPLPININELIHGRTVEWERIELKEGWNPKKVIHSVCAYANDFNDWGGGYIVIGFEEEKGMPKFPPKGVSAAQVDNIQKELLNLCRTKITPSFVPLLEPYDIDGRMILVIWVPAGYEKPYKAATHLGDGAPQRVYIKKLSNTVLANDIEERQLSENAARIPFIERRNNQASLKDFDRGLITEYLETINSSLAEDSKVMPIEELARKLRIASGPDEAMLPQNLGLLFFNKEPEQFFYKARIEIVIFSDNDGAGDFIEKIFSGPLHKQISNALEFLNTNVIKEKVEKISTQAEALRFYNFPYDAIEEALVNAVYHKSYQDQEPVEVRVYPDRLHILNYPGPLPPINKDSMSKGRFNARRYRNSRMGDFLKELRLAETRGTGVPKILKSIRDNQSPKPIFDTDEERTYFEITFPIHKSFIRKEKLNLSTKDISILKFCVEPKSRREILEDLLKVSNRTENYKTNVKHLVDDGLIELTNTESLTDPNQSYFTSEEGKIQLIIM
ncbi:ATP-binding protein [Changchengzhania lutea]|uniref:ATP-binding protein n=1 Tax=Changchengzhania lutea TaxID=2049305 RepID=UPI00115EC8F0|nr:ATP-binding protein [Changchengzhania lutea]